jgi:hypothetical protein
MTLQEYFANKLYQERVVLENGMGQYRENLNDLNIAIGRINILKEILNTNNFLQSNNAMNLFLRLEKRIHLQEIDKMNHEKEVQKLISGINNINIKIPIIEEIFNDIQKIT